MQQQPTLGHVTGQHSASDLIGQNGGSPRHQCPLNHLPLAFRSPLLCRSRHPTGEPMTAA
jgi:hypothetical protein